MSRARLWLKMFSVGAILCIGGPALVIYVSPTEEELFKRFNPELQKRNLESREQRLQDHKNFISQLKEYSKSDKSIWVAAAEDEARMRAKVAEEQRNIAAEIQKRRDEIRMQSISKQ